MKETLMIHEVTEDILKLDLSRYTLTFDDGLYSHFFYWNVLKDIPTTKVFFIPTGAIRLEETVRPQFSGEHIKFPTCVEAMNKWFNENNTEDYLTLGEIKKMRDEGAIIGAHGHMHIEKYDEGCLINRLEQFRKDNQALANWFRDNLNFMPRSYCFPFNKELPIQRAVINVEVGCSFYFGKERKDVAELLCKKF